MNFTSNDTNEISKDFFIKMAKHVLNVLDKSSNKTDCLAKILFEIHSHCLIPFYFTEDAFKKYRSDPSDFWFSYNWENLTPKKKEKSEDIDKDFFVKMATYIINDNKLNL